MSLKVFAILLMVVFVQNVQARPPTSRVKRVSDQRLAELETQISLSKMRGQLVTVPLGFGRIDPNIIGRKRRSQSHILDALFNRSSEEDAGDPFESNYDDDGDLYGGRRR